MDPFIRADLQQLVTASEDVCVSIFTETHPGGDEASRIRVKNQLDEAESKLQARGVRNAAALLKATRALTVTDEFWKHASAGLATFISANRCRLYRLPLSFKNEVFVGTHFHIKAVLPWFAEAGRFYVLAISQNHVRLLEGTAHGVRPISFKAAPDNKEEALQAHDRDELLNVHTHPGSIGRHMEAIFHGHGVGIDDRKTELGQYMHKIDQALCHLMHETNSNAPVVLATVAYLSAIYRAHSHYPRLTQQTIAGNPDHMSDADLHSQAWLLVNPLLHAQEDRMIADFPRLTVAGRTSLAISKVLPAAHRGEIETLLLASGRHAWGTFNPETNLLEQHATPQSNDEELTNLAAIHVLRHHHKAILLKDQLLFGDAALAGVFFVAPISDSVTV